MASELSKTAISRMRVAELRKELDMRGLEGTGIRPVLQARLSEGKAAGVRCLLFLFGDWLSWHQIRFNFTLCLSGDTTFVRHRRGSP